MRFFHPAQYLTMHLFVDNLTNVDFSYLHPERGLLGETWLANIELEGELDEQGMVCDFGTVKKVLRNWLDDEIDHRLAIPVHSPNLKFTLVDDTIELTWNYGSGDNIRQLRCKGPAQSIALINAETVDADSVSRWAIEKLKSHFPTSIEQLSLSFGSEEILGASYHYSHGLKKHDGNCQRIAHGHRSRIEIWQDQQRSPELEELWAEQWCDIYVGSLDDITLQNDTAIMFAYTAEQGDFELDMPVQDCYLMNSDSTVELIAHHIATELKALRPNNQIKVRAFEGINKGALVKL
jgi:6-pyruvoyl-tetrahydropterin synthase